MRKMDLMVVYTNDPVTVEDSINTMEWLLAKDYKYKVVGFDLAYTGGCVVYDQKVVATQLCMHHQVLLYHYCMDNVPYKHLTKFVKSPDYRFATVDTTNDPKVLKTSGLACQKLVDIHGRYKIWDKKKDMDSHVDLAEAIIKPYYRGMKVQCDKNKPAWHSASVKKLDKHYLQTAAKEAYTCYEMFRSIVDIRNCLLPEYVERSIHKHGGGSKCHMK
ncbi:hypothetical protein D1007_35692 [Hordeum vulgare]|nr:hypothetical protein D1007_35692 [Hordeum vulgare]